MTPLTRDGSECGCSLEWCKAKDNGTCATCGGWLPGEKPPSLTAMWTNSTDIDPDIEPCPMGCGRMTEDPYGGPCKHCWELV